VQSQGLCSYRDNSSKSCAKQKG